MAEKQKWYAVRAGRKTGVFDTWKECQSQVIGFSGAIYKSFPSREDAEAFVEGQEFGSGKVYAVREGNTPGLYDSWSACLDAISGYPNPIYKSFKNPGEARAWINGENYWEAEIKKDRSEGILTAYCDGSFNEPDGCYGWGVAIPLEDHVVELSGSDSIEDYLTARNVAGEVMGALTAMRYAIGQGYRRLRVYHDYQGLSSWAKGEWRANTPLSQMYVKVYKEEIKPMLHVTFTKVPAHTGVKYNEVADELAFAAAFGEERS